MKRIFNRICLLAVFPAAALMTNCSTMTPISFKQFEQKQEMSKNGLPAAPSERALAVAAKISKKDKHGYKTYSDRVRTRVVRTTSYSHQEREKGAPGRLNCLGGTLKYGNVRSVAADWSVYPVGTKFRIKGLPHLYVVDDFGSALVGTNTIDIYHPTLKLMRKWNTRKAEITIVRWGDYERSLKLLSKRKRHAHCRKMFYALQGRIERREVARSEVTAEEISKL